MIILVIIFIIGFLLLLFGKMKEAIYDVIGFGLILIAFIWALII